MRLINVLLKKVQKFEWTQKIQVAFTRIKHAISTAPILINPYFNKDFIIYYFASEETIASS
jgi:hypothetical protein